MKGFKIKDGDVSITNNKIDMAEDAELQVCTLETVLKTRKGEDIFDSDEGVDFGQILGKGITADMVKSQIKSGINQVDPEYTIRNFDFSVDKSTREATVNFTAQKSNGTIIGINSSYE